MQVNDYPIYRSRNPKRKNTRKSVNIKSNAAGFLRLSIVMRCLRKNMRRTRPDWWKGHSMNLSTFFLNKNQTNIKNPPYCSYSAHMTFPKLKLLLRGSRSLLSMKELEVISSIALKRCSDDGINHWHMCITLMTSILKPKNHFDDGTVFVI